ncbi:MAG: glycoside hydrolase family 99-like domain-containing protein [Ignavibacteriaceae bacterium]|nr:glycoside hydrolase family 99-like domain-containing protein [Ignavibacteriaceae bacterium]
MKNNFNLVIFAYLFSCLIYCQQAFGQTKFDNLSAMYIQNVSNQSVLSVKSIDYNTIVSIGTESETYENEWFIVQDAGDSSYYRLKNLYSSKIMSNTSNGTLVVTGEGSDDNQRWNLVNEGTNVWGIENVKTGSYLTLDNNTLSLKTKDNSASQKWNIKMVNPDYAVPEPKPLNTGRYMIGAEMCNLWDVATRPDCWKQIAPYPDRKPVTGWFKEGSPEVMDWDIKMAVDNGISFFMPCWFRTESSIGKAEVKGTFDQWIDGLEKAKYKDHIKFMIMWITWNIPGTCGAMKDKEDFLNNIAPYFIEHFFKNPNYLKIDNKPVISFFYAPTFINECGGPDSARDAITKFKLMVKTAGFKDLILIGQWCTMDDPQIHDNSDWKRIGADYSSGYHWPSYANGAFMVKNEPDYYTDKQMIAAEEYCWNGQAKGAIPNIVTCTMGFDDSPWSGKRKYFRLSPNSFTTLLKDSKSFIEKRNQDNLASHIILLDNWDEFGEGHYIYPTEQYGFEYLKTVKRTFFKSDF